MSPSTIKLLRKGHFVASRMFQDLRRFSHVGQVSKHSPKAVWVIWGTTYPRETRIPYADKKALAEMRTADVAEQEGYKRWVQ